MGSIVIYTAIAIAVAAVMVAVFVLVLPDDTLARPVADVVPPGLPADREIGADDLARLRLPVTVRGYRMVDTDAVLDRLSAEIDRRDREIAQLRMAQDRAGEDGPDPRVGGKHSIAAGSEEDHG